MTSEEQATCGILAASPSLSCAAADADAAKAASVEWVAAAAADIGAAALVERLQDLPYAARVSAITRWASRHAKDPAGKAAVCATVKVLTKHDETAPIEGLQDDDEEMANIFPGQKTR